MAVYRRCGCKRGVTVRVAALCAAAESTETCIKRAVVLSNLKQRTQSIFTSSAMPYLKLRDGAELFYKDWGNPKGEVVTFSHGWPLSSDNWENQMMYLADQGYRVIGHDRRGHGRSTQTWDGNNMDTFVDDLEELFEHLKVKDAVMVGHSHGGGEVTHYLGKHGTGRVKKAVLVGAVPPLMLKTSNNPEGTEKTVFDSFRQSMREDRAQFFLDVASGPFFGFNREGSHKSEGQIRSWWQQGMNTSLKTAYDCVKDFSETDFSGDLKKIDVPVLVLHGDDDQVVPIQASALKSVKLLAQGKLKIYKGGSHAIHNINVDEVNRDLLEFIQS
uniref:ARAD1A19206p n=1 Tax=Blastobotrys adeninivorans TaxID=409370 RepID=A0A060SYR9_BLAAD